MSDDPSEMKDPTGKYDIDEGVLFVLSTGADRFKNFFDVFALKLKDRTDPSRLEDLVSLAAVEGYKEAVQMKRKEQIERWVTLDKNFLLKKKVITVKLLQKELKELNSGFDKKDRVKLTKNSKENAQKKHCHGCHPSAQETSGAVQ